MACDNGAVGFKTWWRTLPPLISRSQVWQWVHNNVRLDTGETVTAEFVRRILDEDLAAIRAEIGDQACASSRFDDARQLFEQVALADDFADFLALPAYAMVD
jgi:malate synthase